MAIAKNTTVRQKITPIEGTVTGYQVDAESGEVLIQVSWDVVDEHGYPETRIRYFKEADLEVVVGS